MQTRRAQKYLDRYPSLLTREHTPICSIWPHVSLVTESDDTTPKHILHMMDQCKIYNSYSTMGFFWGLELSTPVWAMLAGLVSNLRFFLLNKHNIPYMLEHIVGRNTQLAGTNSKDFYPSQDTHLLWKWFCIGLTVSSLCLLRFSLSWWSCSSEPFVGQPGDWARGRTQQIARCQFNKSHMSHYFYPDRVDGKWRLDMFQAESDRRQKHIDGN